MADVFISYHEASAGELAEGIADRLDEAGISCWCARRDMPLGGNFAREIPSRIHDCRLFLLILNESVYHSEHIESEVGIAFSRRNKKEDIRILPLEIGDFTRKDWVEYYLIHAQSVKFPENPDEQRIQKLVKRIAKLLGKESAPQQKPKPQPPIQTPPPRAKPETSKEEQKPPAEIINSGKCGDNVNFTLGKNGVLTISGTGPMLDFWWNRNLYAPWSKECKTISHIEIQNDVTSIGRFAFYGCTSLTSITIPDSVTTIGAKSFYGCTELTSVTIPDSVTEIEWSAFYGCDKLTSVSVPAKAEIAADAFPRTTYVTRRE
ncbi:MAG: leucine-rich repeat protein [Oscillibacter sp.]|nr:leucine-rich repeat protein [Oscillibacter sp.]